jgi:pimeloyl-ACP methyl ester carboxylesterase
VSDGRARAADEVAVPLPPYTLIEKRTGSGTPVVLLHGLSGSSRWWSRNVEALAESHLVATADLGRFGQLPFEEITALVARWLETFGEPVHLFGHSMGGLIAIGVAAERPDLVRSLVLISAVGIPFRLNPIPHVMALPKPPFGGPRIARLVLPDFFRSGPVGIAVAGTRVLLADIRERMRAIRVPTLLVWGEADPLVPLRYGEAMQQEIPGSRLEVIPRAAHVPMWDTPSEFNRVALSFLSSVPAHPPGSPIFSWGLSGWTDGIAHRQSGPSRDIVLIHGLGMSSRYFAPFARELFARGWNPIAPDLPGFGESTNAPASGPASHASLLAAWADALSIRDAVWVGHSIGCNAVAHLAQTRPDLVRKAVYLGPLWTATAHPQLRFFPRLVLDAVREPLSLYRFVIPAYWRAGIWRWWRTWQLYVPDMATPPPAQGTFLAGTRDPLPDQERVEVGRVEGAHACQFSNAREVAEALQAGRPA